jgi:hypothetical protein
MDGPIKGIDYFDFLENSLKVTFISISIDASRISKTVDRIFR